MPVDNDTGSFDPVFGQNKAFSLLDDNVNPKVLSYLSKVRHEALHTNVIMISSLISQTKTKRHGPEMYDENSSFDPAKRTKIEDKINALEGRIVEAHEWLSMCRHEMETHAEVFQGYDQKTLDILLDHLRDYISNNTKGSEELRRLLKALDVTNLEEKQRYSIDEKWASDTISMLSERKLNSIQDVKDIISRMHTTVPRGQSKWLEFVLSTEPRHTLFVNIVTSPRIWILVKNLAYNWLQDLTKDSRNVESLTQWLLYTVLHLPERLTADHISVVRDLGKACVRLKTSEFVPCIADGLPTELEELKIEVPEFLGKLTAIDLSIIAIAQQYGQKDLLL